ncbi:C40 family peptidase [Nonomuraea dietziae]|uniref:C40 family peptidase n=1 Tax=Nonomuraea dietziae TaxID=65515 RepID=UPI0033CF3065
MTRKRPALAAVLLFCCMGSGYESVNAGEQALNAALEMRGVPYSWGGGGANGPSFGIGRGATTVGFDCSGLTQYAWARAGVRIKRTARGQWRNGWPVPEGQVRPGDLVFYDSNPVSPGPEHVGIAVDGERIVHAPSTGGFVTFAPLVRRGYMGAARPAETAPTTSEAAAG